MGRGTITKILVIVVAVVVFQLFILPMVSGFFKKSTPTAQSVVAE